MIAQNTKTKTNLKTKIPPAPDPRSYEDRRPAAMGGRKFVSVDCKKQLDGDTISNGNTQ